MGFWSVLFAPPAPERAPAARTRERQTKPVESASTPDQLRRSSSGIDYRLQRVRRKSIGLVITTDGLLIRAPKWTPLYEIDAAIAERRTWIAKAIARQSERRNQLAAYRDGGHVLFRGKKIRVEVRQGLFESIDLTDQHCIVTSIDGNFDPVALDGEIRRLARQELSSVAVEMATRANLPLTGITISSARTMWGSCTVDGRVRLNFRLLQLAPELMRHVVAHELAHLIEFNHSKRFWAIVETLDPAMAANKRAIKGYAVLLEL